MHCVFKKVKLINHDCLPILMLLYVMLYIVLAYLMLYIVLAYLMLFAALTNAVCLYNAVIPNIFYPCPTFFIPKISRPTNIQINIIKMKISK